MKVVRASWRRWLALAVLGLVLAGVFVRLGFWQLARAHRTHAVSASVVPLAQVSVLGQGLSDANVGALIVATGHYDAAHQLLIHRSNGASWVLTPLVLSDGSALPVVRGLAPAPAPPAGPIAATGMLQASEPLGSGNTATRSAINTEQLVALWPYSIHDGYVILVSASPASSLQPVAVPILPPRTAVRLLNLFYAFQWWIFAGFVLTFLVKIIRDDVVAARGPLDPSG